MKIHLSTGLLADAFYLPSAHHDDRPPQAEIDMIVLHNISLPPGEFGSGSVENFFCGQLDFSAHPYFQTISHLKVASHLFIDRKGKVIQFVPFLKRAWHAGESSFAGRVRCNDFSIGIELEGTDHEPFTAIQYEKLAEVIPALMQAYPAITRERIVGHSDIAPHRKTDPGPHFDWSKIDEIVCCMNNR